MVTSLSALHRKAQPTVQANQHTAGCAATVGPHALGTYQTGTYT